MLLSSPVTTVPLVGKGYGNKLKKLDIQTIEDLLHHYPARYDDFSKIKKINELIAGETVTVRAQVLEIKGIYTKYGKRLTKAAVADETGQIEVVWFNQPYIVRNIKKDSLINISGSMSHLNNKPAFVSPEYEAIIADEEKSLALNSSGQGVRSFPPKRKERGSGESLATTKTIHTGRLVPIYPTTRGVSSKWLRSRINATIQQFNHLTIEETEFLSQDIQTRKQLIDLKTALNNIHFPANQTEIDQARKRLAFDELFLLQIQALERRRSWQKKPLAKKFSIFNSQFSIQEFIKSLPFELTNAQRRTVDEIFSDLEKDVPMNRLLEGDVGSGKTVVATTAIYAAHLNGLQSALMAPTEVLAEQHYKEISKMLEPFGVKITLKTGSVAATSASGGSPDVFIGTHALLYDSVQFDRPGLIIIDEQHRFGVEQRAKLLKKACPAGVSSKDESDSGVPHLLTMTATPIPRSMALTVYGDLDLSVLDEMPPGRKEVITWVVPNRKRESAYNWIREQIKQGDGWRGRRASRRAPAAEGEDVGRDEPAAGPVAGDIKAQAFVICPLIEESQAETMQTVRAAAAEFERLSKEVFPDLKLALLHGRVKSKEKNEILEGFKNGNYDILVSTQVVEVGIDVPTATMMIIEGADRFGLASLHQLRGRVGRSDRQSYCLLFTESHSRRAYRRLKALEELNDGFKLAELDLKLRGPGEIYGTKQHGIMALKLASLTDVKLIETTRSEAQRLLEKDPELEDNPALKEKLGRMSSDLVEPN